MNEITLKKDIAAFSEHMKKGANHIQAACKIYADAVLNDHTAAYEFERAFPYITQSTWDKMRLAGTGAIEAKVLLLSDRLGAKLMRLPIVEQRRIMIEDVEIIKDKKIVKKNIRKMNATEVKQVFTKNMKIRTTVEQKKAISKTGAKVVPYEIVGKTLHVRRSCILSLKELKLIVQKIG